MKQRHTVHLSVYLVLETAEGILLSLRQNTGYEDNKWGLVAGHAESQETARQALCREVLEEIGIHINPADLQLVHVLHRHSDRENIDLFWKCSRWTHEINNKEPHKCKDLEFFSLNKLPNNIIPYVKDVLTCIKNNQIYSEVGYTPK
jgi:8-oxo-dGTP pyrophosphatase MutT (NUDIX family)